MQLMERVGQLSPNEAYALLRDRPDSALVDVRTRAEWDAIGVPDIRALGRPLATVEWIAAPAVPPNPCFFEDLKAALGQRLPRQLLFICRSGARSLAAARLVAGRAAAEGTEIACINVAEGFEGEVDSEGRRGTISGWKAAGLPWRRP